MAAKKNRAIYQLKVTSGDIHPPIWRRIQVWEDTTLAQLHRVLQIAMSWEDYHLHDFVGMLLWRGPFDAESFSVSDVNQQLQNRFRSAKKANSASSAPQPTILLQ
jgi:hypothetical protein